MRYNFFMNIIHLIFDFIDSILDFILTNIQFYSNPKKFVNAFLKLSNKNVFSKIFSLNIVFYGIVFVFSSFFIESHTIFANFWVSMFMFEIFFLSPIYLIMFISFWLHEIENPFKKIFVFFNLIKTLVFIIPIIFTIMFLQFGDYGYVLLRAISLVTFLILIICGPSLFFFQKLIKKISNAIITLGFLFVLSLNLNNLLLLHSKAKYSLLYDPAASEFYQIEKMFSRLNDIDFTIFDKKIDKLKSENLKRESDFIFQENIIHDFNTKYNQNLLLINDIVSDLQHRQKTYYQLNIYFIELLEKYLYELRELEIEYFKIINFHPSEANLIGMKLEFDQKLITLNDKIIKKTKTEIEIDKFINNYSKKIIKLFEWNLIMFDLKSAVEKDDN